LLQAGVQEGGSLLNGSWQVSGPGQD